MHTHFNSFREFVVYSIFVIRIFFCAKNTHTQNMWESEKVARGRDRSAAHFHAIRLKLNWMQILCSNVCVCLLIRLVCQCWNFSLSFENRERERKKHNIVKVNELRIDSANWSGKIPPMKCSVDNCTHTHTYKRERTARGLVHLDYCKWCSMHSLFGIYEHWIIGSLIKLLRTHWMWCNGVQN